MSLVSLVTGSRGFELATRRYGRLRVLKKIRGDRFLGQPSWWSGCDTEEGRTGCYVSLRFPYSASSDSDGHPLMLPLHCPLVRSLTRCTPLTPFKKTSLLLPTSVPSIQPLSKPVHPLIWILTNSVLKRPGKKCPR
jgi:hypothetical protein